MYALGFKYGLAALQTLAVRKFTRAATYLPSTNSVGSFLETIDYVYDSTPYTGKALREAVVKIAATHGERFLRDAVAMDLHFYCKQVPEFANELLAYFLYKK